MQHAAHINAVATAVPSLDVHQDFIAWAKRQLPDERARAKFGRMARRAAIGHRWSVLPPAAGGGSPIGPGGFYGEDAPPTSERMHIYAEAAPALALDAVQALQRNNALDGVTHLVVASCTGFVAPGIDQIIADKLKLNIGVERTLVGFMGCYAAVAALRIAHHIVRSEPAARVLVVSVELSSLHLQPTQELEPLLAMLQFGDGAAAALVTADRRGFAISNPFAAALAETAGLIRWTIGDVGFAMHLSGEVPGQISRALADPELRRRMLGDDKPDTLDAWAVHAGGRSVLDAVQNALDLAPHSLAASRHVLARFGNMSSATLLFVLADLLRDPAATNGLAIAFGPGLAAEGFRFKRSG